MSPTNHRRQAMRIVKDPNADRTSRTKVTAIAGGLVVAITGILAMFDVEPPVPPEVLERLIEGALLAAAFFLRDAMGKDDSVVVTKGSKAP